MNYYSFKLSNANAKDFVKKIELKSNDIEINQIYFFQNEIKVGDLVFINFGGDNVTWEKGLKGIAVVSKEPFDFEYEKKYFRIQVDMKIKLDKAIARSSMIPYLDLYDVAGIGPTTKGVQTQAISKLEEGKALLIVRVILDSQPNILKEVESLFSKEQMNLIKSEVTILEKKLVRYGEVKEDKVIYINSLNIENSFYRFMKERVNKRGVNFDIRTIDNYVNFLKRTFMKEEWIKNLIPEVTNLFNITDVKKFKEFKDSLLIDEKFLEYNKTNHYTPISSLIQYEDFLLQYCDLNKVNIVNVLELNKTRVHGGFNKIFYGSPGCGKSYKIKKILEDLKVLEEDIFRTTFYQDYSYTDFVGQIYPVMKNNNPEYEFVPGPFTIAFQRAILNPNNYVYLIIEELNRGNAPSIFGDLFQLFDRFDNNENGKLNGESIYPIINLPLMNYMSKLGIELKNISFPSNLNILATLNSTDQNVFTLDSAFKRRWNSEKVQNKFDKNHDFRNWIVPGTSCTWEKFVSVINNSIINKQSAYLISEDKQIGVYFFTKNELNKDLSEYSHEKTIAFANKMFEYLWNDVAKFNRDEWFVSDLKSLDDLIDRFILLSEDKLGLQVFENAKIFE